MRVAVRDRDILTEIVDKSGREGVIKTVSYAELRSGSVEINGKKVPTASLSSIKMAREIAEVLKRQISSGEFLLTQPVASLPKENKVNKLEIRGNLNGQD